MKHIINSQQFTKESLEELFSKADIISEIYSNNNKDLLRKKLLGKRAMLIFVEPSTRTRISFESACLDLGMNCIVSDNAGEMSSLVKGEIQEHMFEVLCQYNPDVIIMRQKQEGLIGLAADICNKNNVRLINAGDGKNQHPTQALLDTYTIRNRFGRLDNLNIMIGGDLLRSRTVHSLTYLLAKYEGNNIYFTSPEELSLPGDIVSYLIRHNVSFEIGKNFRHKKGWADVMYWTRVQSERSDSETTRLYLEQVSKDYILGLKDLSILANQQSVLMHPLPIKDEILREVETDHRAIYLTTQVKNGLYIRTSLLLDIFDKDPII